MQTQNFATKVGFSPNAVAQDWPDEAHIHDCRPHAGMSLNDLMDEMAESRGEPHPPGELEPE